MKKLVAFLSTFMLVLLAGLSLAKTHTFEEGAKASPAPLDKQTKAKFQTATFALG